MERMSPEPPVQVVGIGLDLVEVTRVQEALQRHGERFSLRLCGPSEHAEWSRQAEPVRSLSVRFALKEAGLKALGTGWAEGVSFSQVEVILPSFDEPEVRLCGAAAERAEELGGQRCLATVSEREGLVAALVVLVT